MTDPAPASSAPASCCSTSCCPPGCCPCATRLAKLEKTVCRIRTGLLIALGVLILLIGIAIGKSGGPRPGSHEEFRVIERHVQGPMGGPGPMMHPQAGGPGHGPGPGPGARGPMDDGPRRDRMRDGSGPRGERPRDGGPREDGARGDGARNEGASRD